MTRGYPVSLKGEEKLGGTKQREGDIKRTQLYSTRQFCSHSGDGTLKQSSSNESPCQSSSLTSGPQLPGGRNMRHGQAAKVYGPQSLGCTGQHERSYEGEK